MAETAEQLRVRNAVARMVGDAIARASEMLRLRLLLPQERFVPGGIAIGTAYFETFQDHARALERIFSLLVGLRRRLEQGPVPDPWHTNDLEGGGTFSDSDPDPLVRALRRYFYQYAGHCAVDLTAAESAHLDVIHGTWTDRAHMTGIHVWVPDPSKPETVLRLDPTLAPRGPTIDLWRDERGRLFYLSHGHRNYIIDSDGQFPVVVTRHGVR